MTTTLGADALIGQMVGGRFLVKRLLAKGGMAVVYEAEQKIGEAHRKVALKTLRMHAVQDPSMVARFRRECDTVAALTHPNIVRVYDFGQTEDGILYIAMEFVSGKALSDVMEEAGPMPPLRVLSILHQITSALQEAHAQGVVHRDLKPDNVVLQFLADQEDSVKLLDFGIAARTLAGQPESKLTQQGIVLGTPPYMSPEQFTGGTLDARSDIYALGVLAYEMLTGHLPLQADSPWQWASAHMKDQPIPFEAVKSTFEIPSPMRHAIMRALSKSRDERQQSVKQFFEEISATSTTSPMDAPPAFQSVGGTTPMPAVASISYAPTSLSPSAYPQVPPASVAAGSVMGVPSKHGGRRMILWTTLAVLFLAIAGAAAVLAPRLLTPDDPAPPYPTAAPPASAPASDSEDQPDDSPGRDLPVIHRQKPAPRPSAPHVPSQTPASAGASGTGTGGEKGTPAPPLGGFQCQSDAQCGFHRCNTDTQRCIVPCAGDQDCRAGAQCKILLGVGGCVPAVPAANASAAPSGGP